MASSSSSNDPLASVFNASAINEYVKDQVKRRKTQLAALEVELESLRNSKQFASMSEHGDLVRTIHIDDDKAIAAWKSLQDLKLKVVRTCDSSPPTPNFPDDTNEFDHDDDKRPLVETQLNEWRLILEDTNVGMIIYGRLLGVSENEVDWSRIFPMWFQQANDIITQQTDYGFATMQLFSMCISAQVENLPSTLRHRMSVGPPIDLSGDEPREWYTTQHATRSNQDIITIGAACLRESDPAPNGWITFEFDPGSQSVTLYVCSLQINVVQEEDWIHTNFGPLVEGLYGSSENWTYRYEILFNIASDHPITDWSGPLAAHVIQTIVDATTSRPLWSLSPGLACNREVQPKSIQALQTRHLGIIVRGHLQLCELYEAIKDGRIVPGFYTETDYHSDSELVRRAMIITQ